MGDHTVVFVGGLHRSGTTLLARCLAAHPDVSGFTATPAKEDEGQHLQDVYPAAREYGGAGRFASDPRSHLTEASPLATPANAERLLAQWTPWWDMSRPVLVEKSPANIVRTRFLQALVPGARFLLAVRHPLVVALATRKWRRSLSLARLLDHWFTAHELLLADLPYLRAARVVKYEHLVNAPAEALAPVAAFLGLAGAVPAGAVQPERSAAYRDRWSAMERSWLPWRRRSYRRLLDRYEDRARAFGYSLADLTVAGPFPLPEKLSEAEGAIAPSASDNPVERAAEA